MTSLKLHIVRHAPVVGKKGFIYGDEADIDLESQAAAIQALALALPDPAKADWYHSGVDRAHRTARAVLSTMNIVEASISPHAGFREQDFGELIGQSHEAVTDHLKFVDGKILAPNPPDGESIPAFVSRVANSIANVRQAGLAKGRSDIVIFSHGGTIRAVHAAVMKIKEADFITLDTPPLFAYTCDIGDFSV